MDANQTLIIVPTYNERENVPSLVREIFKAVPEAHVMVVDDNSPDGTADYAAELFKANPNFSVMRREGPRGLGRSYVDGYRKALSEGYARLIQMDADFSHDPRSIPALIEASRHADVVVGSRYCPGGRVGALRRARSTDGAVIRDALAQTSDFHGVAGEIKGFDARRNAIKPIFMLRIEPGGRTRVAERVWLR